MCCVIACLFVFFFFEQKTAYERRISDWSSDVCSSDLTAWASPCCSKASVIAKRWSGRTAPSQYAVRWGLTFCCVRPRSMKRGAAKRRPGCSSLWVIGRASCRERVCQYVYLSVGAVSITTKTYQHHQISGNIKQT